MSSRGLGLIERDGLSQSGKPLRSRRLVTDVASSLRLSPWVRFSFRSRIPEGVRKTFLCLPGQLHKWFGQTFLTIFRVSPLIHSVTHVAHRETAFIHTLSTEDRLQWAQIRVEKA